MPPLGGTLECRDEIWHQKTRIVILPDGEEIMTLAFFVLTQYRIVTDRQTDTSQRPALAQCRTDKINNRKRTQIYTSSHICWHMYDFKQHSP